MKRIVFLVSMAGLFLTNSHAGDFENIYKAIYLGQAYPSGNVYLRPFVQFTEVEHTYPNKLAYFRVQKFEGLNESVKQIELDKVYRNNPQTGRGTDIYVPGIEGLDGRMDFCGRASQYRKNPNYKYIHYPDYFDAWADHCYEFNTFARYRGTPNPEYAYTVLGFEQNIQLSNIRLFAAKTKRPLTQQEQQAVDKEVEANREMEVKGECYTDNQTLSDAQILMSARINETPLSLRLSWFDDPGCMGHMATYYIVDIVDASGHLIVSRSIYVYRGLI